MVGMSFEFNKFCILRRISYGSKSSSSLSLVDIGSS